MKKSQATRRAGETLILRPSRVRMFIIYVIILGLAMGASILFQYLFSRGSYDVGWLQNDIPRFVLILLGGSLLITLLEHARWTMRVEDGDRIEGPSGIFGQRLTIPLREIDWERTRRSLNSRLKFGNAIYSLRQDRVLVSPWFFDPAQFREFLSAIGLDRPGR